MGTGSLQAGGEPGCGRLTPPSGRWVSRVTLTSLVCAGLLAGAGLVQAPFGARADSALCGGEYVATVGDLTVVAGRVFFVATDVDHGSELWTTDGTVPGTRLIRDIRPGAASSSPRGLTAVGGKLLFSADDGLHGRELWVSDGTRRGTRMVKDIRPGRRGSRQIWPSPAIVVDTALQFTANDGVHGTELWRSDGTTQGTRLVKDIAPGPASSDPVDLALVGHRTVWSARSPATGWEPWVSDGTRSGTRLLRDIRPGPRSSKVWNAIRIASGIAFVGDDGRHGAELWTSDLTTRGTHLVKDIEPGGASSRPSDLIRVGWDLAFVAGDGPHGPEPWRSDLTGAGTRLLKDVRVGAQGSTPDLLGTAGSTLILGATDAVHGQEPWRSDGTRRGTRILRDIATGPASWIRSGVDAGAIVLFDGSVQGSPGIWRTDGTRAGTRWLAAARFSGYYGAVRPECGDLPDTAGVGAITYFAAMDAAHGAELWRTDGTAVGTFRVADSTPGTKGLGPDHLTAAGDLVVYLDREGHELWRSDGTAGGTLRLAAFPPPWSSG